jgi:hypothetical protein
MTAIKKNGKGAGLPFSDEEIVEKMLRIFFVAHANTLSTLLWTVAYIGYNKNLQYTSF